MNFGRYTFNCSFLTHAVLPDYKAVIFRDCFARAFKQAVCVLRSRSCDECLLRSECLYAMVFEISHGKISSCNQHSHPFVIEPPETRSLRYLPDDSFMFHLLLFGDTTLKLPYFIHAAKLMGENGFGRRAGGLFTINSVRCGETIIYSEEDQILRQPPIMDLHCCIDSNEVHSSVRLKVYFQTPLRLKYENRLASQLPFHLLIRACLRRISMLLSSFDAGEPIIDYTGIVSDAQRIPILKSNLRRLDWKGYSFRQKQEIHLGGIVGDVSYEGNLSRFLPLIKFCRHTHIGKQTTFGLGRFDLEATETDNISQ